MYQNIGTTGVASCSVCPEDSLCGICAKISKGAPLDGVYAITDSLQGFESCHDIPQEFPEIISNKKKPYLQLVVDNLFVMVFFGVFSWESKATPPKK